MSQRNRNSLLLALLGAVFYVPFLGGVHLFDWDEINFAEISREMILLEDYLRVHINFEPFWEKPPLFCWLQVICMKIFGVGEFAARLPNAICGMLTLPILYRMGCYLKDDRFGWLWAGSYFGSILPFLYFKSGIIDPWFNLFIFSGLWFLVLFYWKEDSKFKVQSSKWKMLVFAGVSIGLGILTKGPVAFLIPSLILGVYWIWERFRFFISPLHYLIFGLVALSTSGLWLGAETLINGPWFLMTFVKYQVELLTKPVAGHQGFFGYHFVVLLIGVFPVSIFAVRSFFKMGQDEEIHFLDFKRWMKAMFWVVLILFSLVQSKIVHYSSLCYFPMTFLAAHVLEQIMDGKIAFAKWMKIMIGVIGGLFVFLLIALPLVGMNIELIKPLFAKDKFALANLDAEVAWSYFDALPGIFLLVVLIFSFRFWKQGHLPKGIKTILGGTAIFVMLTLICVINKIESYSQRAAIQFYKERVGEDCYVATHDYKSYAHLFYSKKQLPSHKKHADKNFLLEGEIDKNVYIAVKIHRAKFLIDHPNFEELYRKNGFVFFKRKH